MWVDGCFHKIMEYNIGRNAIKITVKDVVLSTNSKCLLKCIKSDSVTSVCQKSRESQQHFIRSLYQYVASRRCTLKNMWSWNVVPKMSVRDSKRKDGACYENAWRLTITKEKKKRVAELNVKDIASEDSDIVDRTRETELLTGTNSDVTIQIMHHVKLIRRNARMYQGNAY